MAIYHLHSQFICRSGGRSAVGASAYRSGSKMLEEIIDRKSNCKKVKIHDYSNKNGVIFSAIMTPENAADWMQERGNCGIG
jgi:hypothetical protein